MNDSKTKHSKLAVIGWREWVGLPDLGIGTIKAKVDSGARSSSLYAYGVEEFEKQGEVWVRFKVHPKQRATSDEILAEAKVLDYRSVRSSSGQAETRPTIMTHVELLGSKWPIELTLAKRNDMRFRMLLGREAFRGRFLLDAGHSYYGGKPKRRKK